MAICLLVCFFLLSKEAAQVTSAVSESEGQKQVIVIDPGHGGIDPGMIGVGNLEEKGINLSISLKVKELLENQGFSVVMTRETDCGLYEEDASNKKAQDMQRRIAKIEEADPVLTVSIHQNSYEDASVKGPQVFYYEGSEGGSQLAACLQDALNEGLSVVRPRQTKGNTSYYLLKRSTGTLVIVECGFLTNPEEAALLQTEEYQEKVAACVANGIMSYLQTGKNVEIL